VVSGGAFGIDAAAHQGALDCGAPTFAVLGCGVDVVYPDRHGALFEQIAIGGGLLSEYPAGTPPRAGNFPARNRLIAALVEAVVVVEAGGFRSGALITAGRARRFGVPVLAVPGSAGTDGLLASGAARLVGDTPDAAQDVVDCILGRPSGRVAGLEAADPDSGAGGAALAPLLSMLAERARGAEDVARRLALPVHEVMSLISQAELAGRVTRLPGGQYEVSRVE
jgi:DNA processing protein